ncbi:succinate dehydrogenase assembly factor 2 [Neisseria perflava]|uniref:FAD assembly factor SdhE n=1 Tax=Neisseria perflava TaxID=33053 RepID=UPI00209F628C|nr:succinate dehydrogenase assembly factor 2 [Neisseria perflava]MCP1661258.1 antitoxin CptB [Neisseria perflava]MCP1771678.1 antitoxin CptB [Neisseria perflava]
MMVFDDTAKRKIRFQTRRGLLELDLVFGRFMEQEFEQLSNQELAEFAEILEFQDQELLALINGHVHTAKTHLLPMLEKIRQAGGTGSAV